MTLELIRFGCVGILAMGVHLLCVALLVPLGSDPLAANLAGFLVAFQVSYLGHARWTFRAGTGPAGYFRLFLVACCGFALNEAAYAWLLRFTPLDYRIALAIVLAGIAGATFLASKFWVFKAREGLR